MEWYTVLEELVGTGTVAYFHRLLYTHKGSRIPHILTISVAYVSTKFTHLHHGLCADVWKDFPFAELVCVHYGL